MKFSFMNKEPIEGSPLSKSEHAEKVAEIERMVGVIEDDLSIIEQERVFSNSFSDKATPNVNVDNLMGRVKKNLDSIISDLEMYDDLLREYSTLLGRIESANRKYHELKEPVKEEVSHWQEETPAGKLGILDYLKRNKK